MKRNQSMFFGLLVSVTALALTACGGANPAPPVVEHGNLDLSKTLPAPTPSPYVAYGEGGASSGRALTPNAAAEIAPYLRAQTHAGSRLVASRAAERVVRKPLLPARPESDVAAVASKDTDRLVINTESAREDAQDYAQRESQKAESYRGGDTVVITVGTVLLILLIVILILLIVR